VNTDATKTERFWCGLHQENGHGAIRKNTLVYCRFLHEYKEETNNFWRPEKLAMCAIFWCIFYYEKRLGIPRAQAGAKRCILKKTRYPAFYRLGRSVFPIEFDRAFFEQLELSSAEENEKRIIKKGVVFHKISTSHHFAHSGAHRCKNSHHFCTAGASDNFKSPRVDYTEGLLAFLHLSNFISYSNVEFKMLLKFWNCWSISKIAFAGWFFATRSRECAFCCRSYCRP